MACARGRSGLASTLAWPSGLADSEPIGLEWLHVCRLVQPSEPKWQSQVDEHCVRAAEPLTNYGTGPTSCCVARVLRWH